MIEFPRPLWEHLSDEFDLSSDYSGRGMFGDECIGLTGDVRDLMLFIARISTWHDVDDDERDALLEHLADNARSDNMGQSMIFYWPHVKVSAE